MQINPKKLVITVTAEEEDMSLRHVAKEYAPGFVEAVQDMLKKSRTWGWCTIKVSVRFKGLPDVEGTAYLGECSYASKKDFIDNSDYYEDKVHEATQDLVKEFQMHCEDLAEKVANIAKIAGDRHLKRAAKDIERAPETMRE